MLDTTRAYAREKLQASGTLRDLSMRHAHYYLALFQRAQHEAESRVNVDWSAAYAPHLEDLRAAINWSFSDDGDGEIAVDLTIASVALSMQLALLEECLARVDAALALLDQRAIADDRRRMKLYAARGACLLYQSAGPETGAAFHAALEFAEKVVEMNWRATHLITLQRNLAVVPNSTIAKTRLINTSHPAKLSGATAKIQLRPDVRPQIAITALTRAVQGCTQISSEPPANITIKSSTVDFVEYDVCYFTPERGAEAQVTTRFLDIAHRHLTSLRVPRAPVGAPAEKEDPRGDVGGMVDLLSMFDGLTSLDRSRLIDHFERRCMESGVTLLEIGAELNGIYVIEAGVLSVQSGEGTAIRDLGRLNPGDHWGGFEGLAGGRSAARLVPLCRSSVLFLPNEQIRAVVPASPGVFVTQPMVWQHEQIGDDFEKQAAHKAGTEHLSFFPDSCVD